MKAAVASEDICNAEPCFPMAYQALFVAGIFKCRVLSYITVFVAVLLTVTQNRSHSFYWKGPCLHNTVSGKICCSGSYIKAEERLCTVWKTAIEIVSKCL